MSQQQSSNLSRESSLTVVSSSSSEVGPPKDLLTGNVTDSSFVASWTAPPGTVQTYQIKWKSMFSEESGQMRVPGDTTSAVLDGLSPETLYQVSVVASYKGRDSGALTGQETTDGTSKTLLVPFSPTVSACWRSKVKERSQKPV